jgi:hypothetical protein
MMMMMMILKDNDVDYYDVDNYGYGLKNCLEDLTIVNSHFNNNYYLYLDTIYHHHHQIISVILMIGRMLCLRNGSTNLINIHLQCYILTLGE